MLSKMPVLRAVVVLALVGRGGGDGDGAGSGVSCDAVPACVTEAVTALEACVTTPTLAMSTPVNNSGVVDNLRCTGGDLTVALSTFSFSATGTVPLPSTINLTTVGTLCAVVHRSNGTTTDRDGNTKTFEVGTIGRPGAEAVSINTYANGDIGMQCGGRPTEVIASAGALASCAAKVRTPRMVRDAAITMMNMQLLNAAGASADLFTCTR